jgi:hypothetical protein
MAEEERKHPRYGGWQLTATALTDAGFGDVSRQMVYGWWLRRDKINFPDGVTVRTLNRRGESRERVMLPVDEVIEWRRTYVPDPGGRPRKERK